MPINSVKERSQIQYFDYNSVQSKDGWVDQTFTEKTHLVLDLWNNVVFSITYIVRK